MPDLNLRTISQLPVKVDKDLKDAFIKCCKSQDSSASQELRKFMKDYVRKYSQQDLFLVQK